MGTATIDLAGTTAVVTGASRGLGRGIATALVNAGASVVGVARGERDLKVLHAQLGDPFTPVAGDAADPDLARDLLERYRPRTLVLNAGATPPMSPVHQQTWEVFSRNWNVDTRQVFEWAGQALRQPLAPGSVVVAISSGAALRGSPISGGYSAAKTAARFIASYAAEESDRAGLGIRFVALLPQLTVATELGAAAAAAYASRQSVSLETFAAGLGPVLTPEAAGASVVEIATGRQQLGAEVAYQLTAEGLQPLG